MRNIDHRQINRRITLRDLHGVNGHRQRVYSLSNRCRQCTGGRTTSVYAIAQDDGSNQLSLRVRITQIGNGF